MAFTAGLTGALAGCGATGGTGAGPVKSPRLVNDPGWSRWVAGFRDRALPRGISPQVFDSAFSSAGFAPDAVRRDRAQAEFRRSFEDYLALVADDGRIASGRAALARHGQSLSRIESRWGVPAPIVAAIWGIESRYGARRGAFPVIAATSTLAYDGRRGAFFEAQTLAALRILQRGEVSVVRFVGSWAGAMGHTQFIPTSYLANAVDVTGDGRADVWGEDPSDALASTANYLARAGWRRGAAWGGEIGTPAAGPRRLRPDPNGPVFGVGRNFDVIKRYNNSDLYALAVGYLADRIAGGGPLRAGFGPDRFGLTAEDRRAIQRGLRRRGFEVGEPDGVFGPRTTAAVRDFQRRAGLEPTGSPSRALLAALR